MTLSSDKEFEKWFEELVKDRGFNLNITGDDVEKAWDHQQSKLDAKDEILREAIQCLKYYNYPDIDETGRGIVKSGCVANDFLNKPEIKQLRGEG